MGTLGKHNLDLGFLRLIFGGRGLEKHDTFDNYICDDDDMTNIPLNVLNLFKNLQTMVLKNIDDYPFSLYQLLHTKIEKVEINSFGPIMGAMFMACT